MVRADVFLRVLLWFSAARLRRLSEFSAGGVGRADKKWKENFWFRIAASVSEKSSLIVTFLFALFYIFAATRVAYNSVCAKAQSNPIVLAPPAQCAHKTPPF